MVIIIVSILCLVKGSDESLAATFLRRMEIFFLGDSAAVWKREELIGAVSGMDVMCRVVAVAGG